MLIANWYEFPVTTGYQWNVYRNSTYSRLKFGQRFCDFNGLENSHNDFDFKSFGRQWFWFKIIIQTVILTSNLPKDDFTQPWRRGLSSWSVLDEWTSELTGRLFLCVGLLGWKLLIALLRMSACQEVLVSKLGSYSSDFLYVPCVCVLMGLVAWFK